MAGLGPLFWILIALMVVFLVLAWSMPERRVHFLVAVVVCLVIGFVLFATGHAAAAALVVSYLLG
jgi:hypothetical protein